jgi:hypothetical protein
MIHDIADWQSLLAALSQWQVSFDEVAPEGGHSQSTGNYGILNGNIYIYVEPIVTSNILVTHILPYNISYPYGSKTHSTGYICGSSNVLLCFVLSIESSKSGSSSTGTSQSWFETANSKWADLEHTHKRICVYIYTYVCMYACMHVCMYVNIDRHTYIYIYTYTYIHTHAYIYIL